MIQRATEHDTEVLAGLALLLWDNNDVAELRDEFTELLKSEEAACFLTQQKLCLLGTDGLSAAPPDNEGPIHRLLLQRGIALLENLQLAHVPDGSYILCAFPLKIADGDGSPVRAVLLQCN